MTNTLKELKEYLEYYPKTGLFVWIKSSGTAKKGSVAGHVCKFHDYVSISIKGKRYSAHRLAWLFMTGELPKEQVDHINGEREDNRFSNLRECNNSQNKANTPLYKNNKSGFKGVYPKGEKYYCNIRHNNVTTHVGAYDTKIEAAQAYNKKARELFGEFALLNKFDGGHNE